MMETVLMRGILSILLVIMMTFGWLWNILIVVAMIYNRLPVCRRHYIAGLLPYGLSLYFTGIGIGLAIAWYQDFQDGRYPEVEHKNLIERLHNVEIEKK